MPNSHEAVCVNCGERIVLVRYSMGIEEWTHQPAGASFQDGAHQYCHKTIAAPRGEVKWMQSTGSPVAHVTDSYDDVRARLEASIRLGIAAEEDWDGPSVKPGDLTDDQITWMASWLAGEGYDKARDLRQATWADAATLMRDEVRRCNDDPAWDPCRKRLAQEYANAFQLYARDLGDPYRRILKQLAREAKR